MYRYNLYDNISLKKEGGNANSYKAFVTIEIKLVLECFKLKC